MREEIKKALNGNSEKPFTDKDLMPFGKYQGIALANVPATYLLWWYNKITEQNTSLGGNYLRLKLYVADVLDLLKKEAQKEINTKNT